MHDAGIKSDSRMEWLLFVELQRFGYLSLIKLPLKNWDIHFDPSIDPFLLLWHPVSSIVVWPNGENHRS